MPFDQLAEAIGVDIHQRAETDEASEEATSLGRRRFGRLRAIRDAIQQQGCANLLGLMRNAGVGHASNPADYLYGVLGIADCGDDVEIQPDYAEPVQTTLLRFAKHLVLKEGGLEIISQVNQSTWCPGLPTWIPIWATHNDRCTMWANSIEPPFNAAGSTSFEMTLCDVPEMSAFWLVVKGVMVDVVSMVGDDNRHTRGAPDGVRIHELSFDLMRQYILEAEVLRRNCGSSTYYRDAVEWHEAVIKTLVAREDLSELKASDFRQPGGYDYFDVFDILMEDIPQPKQMPQWMDYDMSVLNFVSQVYGVMDWGHLALTRSGLLGRLPYGTQAGDIVCIFAGCKIPFVLRRRIHPEAGNMVLGPCFLSGVMNGELAHALEGSALMDVVLN